MTLPYTRAEARDWAREHLSGVANTLIASYTNDLRDINEAAIRHDVRLEIEHGFMGFLTASETALTPEEYVRFVATAVDEAAGRAMVIHHASFDSLESNIEMACRAANAGAPIKAEGGHPAIGGFVEAWERLGDRVVVSEPIESVAMTLAQLVPLQFSGTSNQEYYGDVIPRMFDLIRHDKHAEAMSLYWQIHPARRAKRQSHDAWRHEHRSPHGVEVPGLVVRLQRRSVARTDGSSALRPDVDAATSAGVHWPACDRGLR